MINARRLAFHIERKVAGSVALTQYPGNDWLADLIDDRS
jgi:hypothetical protein